MARMLRTIALLSVLIALPAAAQPAPKPASPPISRPAPTRPSADQCRATCARSYYFCIAENEIEACSPAWAQCRSACGSALRR